MAQLKVITSDSQDFIGRELPLEVDEVTIGRLPESTIIIPDAAVSRRHAKIVRTPDGFMLVDDGGRNGLFVNSERTTHAVLSNGDVIRVGHTEMVFEGGARQGMPGSPPARSRAGKPAQERLEQTTMLEAALLTSQQPRRRTPTVAPETLERAEELPAARGPLTGPARHEWDDSQVSGRSPDDPVATAAVTAPRLALALALLLAGVLMVTGVLMARERGLLRHGAGFECLEGPRDSHSAEGLG